MVLTLPSVVVGAIAAVIARHSRLILTDFVLPARASITNCRHSERLRIASSSFRLQSDERSRCRRYLQS